MLSDPTAPSFHPASSSGSVLSLSRPQQPLISCIMPTYNRREFVPHAIRYFLRQDYPDKELIVIDDGEDSVEDLIPPGTEIRYYRLERKLTLGAKLNLGCEYARGDLIAHWDDDDWYAPRRLQYQEQELQRGRKSLCGINRLLYYDLRKHHALLYIYPPGQRVWLIGSSLFYRKDLWKTHRFADINVGMDGLFVWSVPEERITVSQDSTISVHMIHDHNVSPKKTEGSWWKPYPVGEIQRIMDADYCFYSEPETMPPAAAPTPKLIKNVFACLVHEKADCIADLVSNLRYQDPSSIILLYNGSKDPDLLKTAFPAGGSSRTGQTLPAGRSLPTGHPRVFFHPSPAPMQHGYLHGFALHCMEFALEHFAFDTLTIVDSDQLCLRKGYSEFLTAFFASPQGAATGMLSSKPERIKPDNKTNPVAILAFKEYELWAPFLQSFPDGDQKFVHWSFWPSTVFTRDAIRDLVRLFRQNEQLREIMARTKIWATEEVILPTLVRLLGYEIAANPCSYAFVHYKKTYTLQDIHSAFKKKEAYWIHPVERNFDHPLRKHIRQQCRNYITSEPTDPSCIKLQDPLDESLPVSDPSLTSSILDRIKRIEGWLSGPEAGLLISVTLEACKNRAGPVNLAEVGSYHGKSTIVLGMAATSVSAAATLYAVDSHDGKLGAVDQGLRSYPPSLEKFRSNIRAAGLTEAVRVITDKSYSAPWSTPLCLLFIDGLHDYFNVARDFRYFSDRVLPGGMIAFHDYADYFPGVRLFVNELLKSGLYAQVRQVESLIILRKI